MRNIWTIFTRDIRKIRTNVIALIVVLGVTVVPCLYAWFNIAASWDPYGNTRNLKVAVASVDEGYTGNLIPLQLNLGDQVLSALRENTQLNWVFTTKSKAMKGVKSGEYYAAIVIPEDFSTNLMSVFSSDIKKPEITYYSNAKENAIAPKITDTGATTVQQQINDTFSATASSAVSEIVKSSADSITRGLDDTQSELTSAITEVQNNLTDYQKLVKEFQKKGLGDYTKNDTNIFDNVTSEGKLHTAIKNCEYMEELKKGGQASQRNPMTKVYKIVDGLKEYLE